MKIHLGRTPHEGRIEMKGVDITEGLRLSHVDVTASNTDFTQVTLTCFADSVDVEVDQFSVALKCPCCGENFYHACSGKKE